MKNNQEPSNKRRGATVGLVICFVAAIALVGTYTFRQYRNKAENQLAKAEEQINEQAEQQEEEQETTGKDIVIENPSIQQEQQEETPEDTKEEPSQKSTQTGSTASEVTFSDNSKITWPVDGKILINYSMDKTVYFSTLDQYKYNPAVIISGKVGTEVKSAARGIVKSVKVDAETGTTVTVDIGNGYEAVYGQLKEVPVKEGTFVEEGALIGYVSEPTKYYSVEGANLYFQMCKDSKPINPLEYLE